MGSPAMRASHLKENVASLRKLRPASVEAILARVPETVAAIENAARTEWLDIHHDVALTGAANAVLGLQGVRDFNRDALVVSLQGPLLNTLWRAAIALFGLKPSGLFRWAPQAWPQIYRDVGELSLDAAHHRLQLKGMPLHVWESHAWLEGTAGAFEAVYALCSAPGGVDVERGVPGAADFVLRGPA